jgi:hypothetical protein
LFALWQPPVGLFDLHTPLGGGHFEIQLNPDANYRTAAVESLNGARVDPPLGESGYDLVVKNVYFYVCLIKKKMNPTRTMNLNLIEMNILNRTLNLDGNQFFDFTVPPSTFAITVFVQATKAGTTTKLPPSRFKSVGAGDDVDNLENDMKQIQVTYGSVTKPSTLYDSGFAEGDDRMIQRWISNRLHLGQMNKSGAGFENYHDWLKNGAFVHFDFLRDRNDTSSQAKVQIQYNQAFTNPMQLFIVAHYFRSVKIDTQDGHIVSVVSLNR